MCKTVRYCTLRYVLCWRQCVLPCMSIRQGKTTSKQAVKSNQNIFSISHSEQSNCYLASRVIPSQDTFSHFQIRFFHFRSFLFFLFLFFGSDHYITYTLQCNVRCRAVHLQRYNASLINQYWAANLFFLSPKLFFK